MGVHVLTIPHYLVGQCSAFAGLCHYVLQKKLNQIQHFAWCCVILLEPPAVLVPAAGKATK